MRHTLKKIWAAFSMIWISAASTLSAYATEQGTDSAGTASGLLTTMDVLQKVCLGIVIGVVVVVFGFYVAKLVLKKMHVPPVEKSEEKIEEDKE